MIVQYLLNCVPVSEGGPAAELAIDGDVVGANYLATISAIRAFQMKRFGVADGLVDPKGQTFIHLNTFDPYPHYDPFLGGPKGGKQGTGKASPLWKYAPGAGTPQGKRAGAGLPSGFKTSKLPGGKQTGGKW